MARSSLLGRMVGLALAGCLAGMVGGGAGVAAAGEEDLFCPAVRDQLWASETRMTGCRSPTSCLL